MVSLEMFGKGKNESSGQVVLLQKYRVCCAHTVWSKFTAIRFSKGMIFISFNNLQH